MAFARRRPVTGVAENLDWGFMLIHEHLFFGNWEN